MLKEIDSVHVSVELITPEMAEELIKRNTNNFRKPDSRTVAAYAKEMSLGEWKLNGDTIKIDYQDGVPVIVDGQHRLMAVIKSGVPIKSIVVRGVNDDGLTVDRGRKRTLSQWCAYKGYPYASELPALAKGIIAHERGNWNKTQQHYGLLQNSPVQSEVKTYIEEHLEVLADTMKVSKSCKLLTCTVLGTIIYVGCGGKKPSKNAEAVWFVNALNTGENISHEDPVYHLRKKLLDSKLANTLERRMNNHMKQCYATIAWNKTVKGEICSVNGFRVMLTGSKRTELPNKILQLSGEWESGEV